VASGLPEGVGLRNPTLFGHGPGVACNLQTYLISGTYKIRPMRPCYLLLHDQGASCSLPVVPPARAPRRIGLSVLQRGPWRLLSRLSGTATSGRTPESSGVGGVRCRVRGCCDSVFGRQLVPLRGASAFFSRLGRSRRLHDGPDRRSAHGRVSARRSGWGWTRRCGVHGWGFARRTRWRWPG